MHVKAKLGGVVKGNALLITYYRCEMHDYTGPSIVEACVKSQLPSLSASNPLKGPSHPVSTYNVQLHPVPFVREGIAAHLGSVPGPARLQKEEEESRQARRSEFGEAAT